MWQCQHGVATCLVGVLLFILSGRQFLARSRWPKAKKCLHFISVDINCLEKCRHFEVYECMQKCTHLSRRGNTINGWGNIQTCCQTAGNMEAFFEPQVFRPTPPTISAWFRGKQSSNSSSMSLCSVPRSLSVCHFHSVSGPKAFGFSELLRRSVPRRSWKRLVLAAEKRIWRHPNKY